MALISQFADVRSTGAVIPASERWFTVAALAYFAKAFAPIAADFQVGGFSPEGALLGNAVDQLIGGSIYVVSIWLLVRNKGAVRAVSASPLLAAFIVLALVSVLWSSVPAITWRRAGGLLGTAAFAAYLACRFTPPDVLRKTAAAFAIATGLSIFCIIFVPSYGTADGTEIAGVFGQKNELGRAMVFAVLVNWALIRDSRRAPAWAVPTLVAAFTLLVLSQSAQAVVGLAAAALIILPVLVLCAQYFSRVNLRLGLVLLVVAGAAAMAVSVMAEQMLALLERDATLTDRTVIWELLVEYAQETPWLGRGYGAFWLSDVSMLFDERWGAIDHSHNGYMDLWLELGYFGVVLFTMLLLSASKTAWDWYLRYPSPAGELFPAFIVVAALMNCVGRVVPAHNSIYWVLLCYGAMMQLSQKESDRPLRRVVEPTKARIAQFEVSRGKP